VLTNDANGTIAKDFGYMVKDTTKKCVYPVGFDPRWFQSDQLLAYTNNFKMKTAVIFAILQMSMGIIIKGINSLYFRKMLDFFFEFIPQIVLLLALFGWMDVLIIGKWGMEKNVNTIYNLEEDPSLKTEFEKVHYAPAIITTMIDIFLAMASNKDADNKDKYLYVFPKSQQSISLIFLVVTFICVPTMLLVKPLILKKRLENDAHHHHHGNEVQVSVE
jgi:V-type H+-transporting ATPase subunit a